MPRLVTASAEDTQITHHFPLTGSCKRRVSDLGPQRHFRKCRTKLRREPAQRNRKARAARFQRHLGLELSEDIALDVGMLEKERQVKKQEALEYRNLYGSERYRG